MVLGCVLMHFIYAQNTRLATYSAELDVTPNTILSSSSLMDHGILTHQLQSKLMYG